MKFNALILLIALAGLSFTQNITNTLPSGGTWIVKDSAANLVTVQQSSKSVDIAGAATVNSTLSVKNGTNAGKIDIYEPSGNGTNKVTIQSQAMSSDYTLTLPNNAGSNGQMLTTNGSGSLSWTTPTQTSFLTIVKGFVVPTTGTPFFSFGTLNNVTTFSYTNQNMDKNIINCPYNGKIKRLSYSGTGTSGNGVITPFAITYFKNGSSVTMSSFGTVMNTTTNVDLTSNNTFNAGDNISFRAEYAGAYTGTNISLTVVLEFTP